MHKSSKGLISRTQKELIEINKTQHTAQYKKQNEIDKGLKQAI